jgi:hypothetical protein
VALRIGKNTSFEASGLGLREHVREDRRERRQEKAGTAHTMRAWAVLVPERGVKLDLENFPYQREWYSEEVATARNVVWQKAAQVGMSAYAWRWAARRAEQFGDRVIYFFPTDDDVSDFGDQRIEPSIEDSAFLLSRIPAKFVRHKHLKQIGRGWLSLRGTQSKSTVQSVDADALVFDEYDYLNQKNLEQAERRLAGSMAAGRFPRTRRLGYPTVAGYGINHRYERSDKRRWLVTCADCGAEQPIEWKNMRWRTQEGGDVYREGRDIYEDAMEVAEAWRACGECDASLEPPDGERAGPIHAGRWVASRESDVIGYHVPRLIVPRTDLVELVQNFRRTSPAAQEAFWNNDLGLPYSPAEAALSEEAILAACSLGGPMRDSYSGRNPRTAGLDVASERDLSLRISEVMPNGDRRALWIGEPEDFEEALRWLRTFRVDFVVIDSMPERRMAKALVAAFGGRAVLAVYDENDRADAFKYDPKKNTVSVNRTEAIDAMMDSIRRRRNIPLASPPPKYVSQLMAPKRRTVEDSKGRPKRVYESTGPDGDDYAHAEVYDMVAHQMLHLDVQVGEVLKRKRGSRLPSERRGLRYDDDYHPGLGEEVLA